MGRTHLQDAVPMSLGSEFHGWRTTIGEEVERLANVRRILQCVNLGATAIGTTVTAAPGYPALATKYLSDITGIQFGLAEDLIEATSDAGDYVLLSGVIKHTAAKLTKICNDLRMLASGPHCGLNEINLLQMQPGSSIMAGNVWEWTTDWYQEHCKITNSCCGAINPRGAEREQSYDPNTPDVKIPRKVMKGGSYLCAPTIAGAIARPRAWRSLSIRRRVIWDSAAL